MRAYIDYEDRRLIQPHVENIFLASHGRTAVVTSDGWEDWHSQGNRYSGRWKGVTVTEDEVSGPVILSDEADAEAEPFDFASARLDGFDVYDDVKDDPGDIRFVGAEMAKGYQVELLLPEGTLAFENGGTVWIPR